MRFEEFVEEVKSQIKAYLPEKYADAEIEVRDFHKMNETYTGMRICLKEEPIQPVLRLQMYHGAYEAGETMDVILQEMAEVVQLETHSIDLEVFEDYEKVKEHLSIRVCDREKNREYLEMVPHLVVEDLAITYQLQVRSADDINGSGAITKSLLETYGITQEQLHQDAMENSLRINPPEIIKMEEFVKQTMREELIKNGFSQEKIEEILRQEAVPENPLILVTNQEKADGAGVLFYPGMMEEIGEQLSGDYFVLPSSRHEVLIYPDDGSRSYQELRDLVEFVNETRVLPHERLTDQVYHYDAVDKVFEIGFRFEERKRDQMQEKKSVLEALGEKKAEAKEKNMERGFVEPKRAELGL